MGRRRILTAAFLAAALVPQALAAQTTTPHTTRHSNNNNSKTQHHHRQQSPWNRNVLVTGVNAQNYLAPTATPKPPKKNKVNTGGTVFKSIGN
ncbi:MAG: hypothetical protein ACRENA_09340 [Vulcanimicrobiaceae bacterium]